MLAAELQLGSVATEIEVLASAPAQIAIREATMNPFTRERIPEMGRNVFVGVSKKW